jgi:hypothetical protein
LSTKSNLRFLRQAPLRQHINPNPKRKPRKSNRHRLKNQSQRRRRPSFALVPRPSCPRRKQKVLRRVLFKLPVPLGFHLPLNGPITPSTVTSRMRRASQMKTSMT